MTAKIKKRKRVSSDYTNIIWYFVFPFITFSVVLVAFAIALNGFSTYEYTVGIIYIIMTPMCCLFTCKIKTVYWLGDEVATYDILGRRKKMAVSSLKIVYFPMGYFGFGLQPVILKSKDGGFLIFIERGHAPTTEAHPYVKEFRREIEKH